MVRLVAESAGQGQEHRSARKHLMQGLAHLVRADCWGWGLGYIEAGKPPAYISIQHGGFTDERYARFLKAAEHPDMVELTAPFSLELAEAGIGKLVTRLREEIDPADSFRKSDVFELWLEADITPLLLAAKPLNEQCVSFIGMYRKASDIPFTERERQIAHVILDEVPWLHAMGWPEDFGASAPQLSRRQRIVLNLLLEGHSRKHIASDLGLSIHTVSDYVKELYRNFRVQSHAELMRRFMGK